MKSVFLIALVAVAMIGVMVPSVWSFTVTDYEGYLNAVKNMNENLQESLDIEYQNLQDGKISLSEYIVITEVASSQVTTKISEFVTSKPSDKWLESYINHMNGMKKFNEYIVETRVLANQMENGSSDDEILQTVKRADSIKAEFIEYFTNSEKLRPLNPDPPSEKYSAPAPTPFRCEYRVADEYCKHLISQKDTDEELNKLNKLKNLIPDNYNIWSSQIELDSSGIVKLRQINANVIKSDDMDNGAILLAQSDYNDSLLTFFEMQKKNIQYRENVTDLSATCVEGWSNEQSKVMICLKDDMFIMTANNFGETKLAMKQMLNKIDGTLSLPKIGNSNGGGCLIATATYGSEMSPQVQQLRELRDNQLLQTESGTAFMGTFNDIYYSFSPIIADYERENPLFKEAVKIAITPMISTLSLMENAETESEVLSIGLSVIMLNIGMYLGVPAVVIVGIKRRF